MLSKLDTLLVRYEYSSCNGIEPFPFEVVLLNTERYRITFCKNQFILFMTKKLLDFFPQFDFFLLKNQLCLYSDSYLRNVEVFRRADK